MRGIREEFARALRLSLGGSRKAGWARRTRLGALLFITKAGKSYQLKGRIEYHTIAPVSDAMKSRNPSEHPGLSASAPKVEEVQSNSESLA